MRLHGALQESGDGLLESLHLAGELEVLIDVPAGGCEHLIGQLPALVERPGQAVELRLTESGELHTRVLDLLNNGKQLFDVSDELGGAGLA